MPALCDFLREVLKRLEDLEHENGRLQGRFDMMSTGLLFAVVGTVFVGVAVFVDGYVPSYTGRWVAGSALLLFGPLVLHYLRR